jgi:hypothetical protein
LTCQRHGRCGAHGVLDQPAHLPVREVDVVKPDVDVANSDADLHRSRRAISA